MRRLTVTCAECKQVSRVWPAIPMTNGRERGSVFPQFCNYCGAQSAQVNHDDNVDYWEYLTEAYQKEFDMPGLTTSLVHAIFNIWEETRSGSFNVFITRAMKEPDFLESFA